MAALTRARQEYHAERSSELVTQGNVAAAKTRVWKDGGPAFAASVVRLRERCDQDEARSSRPFGVASAVSAFALPVIGGVVGLFVGGPAGAGIGATLGFGGLAATAGHESAAACNRLVISGHFSTLVHWEKHPAYVSDLEAAKALALAPMIGGSPRDATTLAAEVVDVKKCTGLETDLDAIFYRIGKELEAATQM